MKIIEVQTKRGDILHGVVYGEDNKDTCVIITNGNCGNIFENKFLRVVGEVLEKNRICFIYAHNSGAFHRLDTPSANGKPIGNTYELFDGCLEDLDAYVNWAKNYGYNRIILGGHSYGTNKVVYYLSQNPQKEIEKYILISPTDMGRMKESELESIKKLTPIALKFKQENKLDELLPIEFDEYNLYTARSFLDFVENINAKNLPIYSKCGSWGQLKTIKQRGLFIMGEKDTFAYGDTIKHLQTIDNNSTNKNNSVVVIENCGHTFKGKEQELAQAILDFVEEKI